MRGKKYHVGDTWHSPDGGVTWLPGVAPKASSEALRLIVSKVTKDAITLAIAIPPPGAGEITLKPKNFRPTIRPKGGKK